MEPRADARPEPRPVDRTEDVARLFARLRALRPGTPEHDELRDRLVEQHLQLALFFARRYADRGEPFDDVAQAGALGLVKAVNRYDPDRGIQFSTFAGPTILGEIRRHFRDHTWAVHVHRALQEHAGQVIRYGRELTQELGRSPTVAELAARIGLSEERVLESLEVRDAYRTASLDSPAGVNGTLADLLGTDDAAYEAVDLHETLTRALSRLPERERHILQLRFYGNLTQAQIGDELGISQMHVSRLLRGTLDRLRQDLVPAG